MTPPGKPPESLNTLFRILAAPQLLQAVTNQLIETLPQRHRPGPDTRGQLLVDGEDYIHTVQYMCALITCQQPRTDRHVLELLCCVRADLQKKVKP